MIMAVRMWGEVILPVEELLLPRHFKFLTRHITTAGSGALAFLGALVGSVEE